MEPSNNAASTSKRKRSEATYNVPAQLLFKIYANSKINYEKELKGFLRSMTFGLLYGTQIVSLNCLFRKILGKYNYYIFAFIVPLLCGVPIFIENPQRKSLNASTFLTMALEGFYQKIKRKGILRPSKLSETVVFMLANGLLMCQLRKTTVLSKSKSSSWFFVPPPFKSVNTEEQCINEETKKNHCTHTSSCTDSLKKELLKFGSISMLISVAKIIVMNAKSPATVFRKFFKWKTFRLAAFVVNYIGLFKILSCYLTKTQGDSFQNTFLAGSIAGLSYAISPSQTFLLSVLTALIEASGLQIKSKYRLPDLPYTEISFILTNAYILYLRIFDRLNCPRYVYTMLNFCTNNKCEILNEFIHTILSKAESQHIAE